MKELTISEYKAAGTDACPFCLGTDLYANNSDIADSTVWMDLECLSCERRWRVYFELSKYELRPSVFKKKGTNMKQYEDGEACEHLGCLNHRTHPCEGCGRVQGQGKSYAYLFPELDPLKKSWIDAAPYKVMLHRRRYAPTGDTMFQGSAGEYYALVMKLKRDLRDHVAISKSVGWAVAKSILAASFLTALIAPMVYAEYKSITIEPKDVGVFYQNKTQQMRAYGWTAEGAKEDITDQVDWRVTVDGKALPDQPSEVVTIDNTGLATVKSTWGIVVISAEYPRKPVVPDNPSAHLPTVFLLLHSVTKAKEIMGDILYCTYFCPGGMSENPWYEYKLHEEM